MSTDYKPFKPLYGGDKYGIGNGDTDFLKPIKPYTSIGTYLPPKTRGIDWGPSGPPVRGLRVGPQMTFFR